MGAPKGNQNAIGNKGGGAIGDYQEAFADMAYEIALLGATDADLARIFDVSEVTINNWKSAHIEFSLSLKKGKEFADAKVAKALFHRATGYEHPDTHFSVFNGEVTATPTTKHYPPDTTAIIFWLKNRKRANWRDKVVVENEQPDTRLIRRDTDNGDIVIETPDDETDL